MFTTTPPPPCFFQYLPATRYQAKGKINLSGAITYNTLGAVKPPPFFVFIFLKISREYIFYIILISGLIRLRLGLPNRVSKVVRIEPLRVIARG